MAVCILLYEKKILLKLNVAPHTLFYGQINQFKNIHLYNTLHQYSVKHFHIYCFRKFHILKIQFHPLALCDQLFTLRTLPGLSCHNKEENTLLFYFIAGETNLFQGSLTSRENSLFTMD